MARSPSEGAPAPRVRRGFYLVALLAALPVLLHGLHGLAYPPAAVLCLHGFGDRPSDPWTLPASRLGPLLDMVAAAGREPVGLDVLLGEAPRPAFASPPVLLTFDDARPSHAGPVRAALAARGWPALFLVQSDPGARELDDAALRSLSVGPLEVGCHSRTHPRFLPRPGEASEAFRDRLRPEVVGAREELQESLGAPVRAFAYPSGDAPPEAVALVREAGYAAGFTTVYGYVPVGETPGAGRASSWTRRPRTPRSGSIWRGHGETPGCRRWWRAVSCWRRGSA